MNDFIHGRHIGTNREQVTQQNVRVHTLGFCGKLEWKGLYNNNVFRTIPAQGLYTCTYTRRGPGTAMAKKRKSTKQLERDRDANHERMSESKFAQKKSEEQVVKDSLARQQALEQLGIMQEFNYEDHADIMFTAILLLLWRPPLKQLMQALPHLRQRLKRSIRRSIHCGKPSLATSKVKQRIS